VIEKESFFGFFAPAISSEIKVKFEDENDLSKHRRHRYSFMLGLIALPTSF
jgi:hypothetical protein